jgi:predicted dehydrogenase
VVAHYRRELPNFKAIKKIIAENKIGKIKLVRLTCLQTYQSDLIANTDENWRIDPAIAGAGLFYDIGPHQIDMLLYLFGKPINYTGCSMNQSGHYLPEDIVSGIIHFENNILFTGTWGFTMPINHQEERCEIIGENGSLVFSFYGKEFELIIDGKKEIFQFQMPENIQLPMIEKVVSYFLDREENPCSIEDAFAGLKIMQSFVYNN